MQTIVIDAQNLIAGISTNNYLNDSGYSPASKGINPLFNKGVLHWQPKLNPITYAGGRIVVGMGNEQDTNDVALVVDTAGGFYKINSGEGTSTLIYNDSLNDYVAGQSDIKFFNNKYYITSDTDIAEISLPSSYDFLWWTGSLSQTALSSSKKHPLEVVEDTMYIGDGNKLHTVDTAETAVYEAMTLPEGTEITTLIKHTNGRDLIAFCTRARSLTSYKNVKNVAYIINTQTLEFSSEIQLDSMVTSAENVGGIIFVTYGKNLGYFTEAGITFLRELEITNETDFILKNMTCNLADMFLTVANNKHSVLGVKDLGLGKSFFFPIDVLETELINNIFPITQNSIILCKDTALYTCNFTLDNETASSKIFYSNKYPLPARAWIRKIEVDHTPFAVGIGLKLYTVDESGTLNDLGTKDYTTSANAKFSRWDTNVFTDMAQIGIQAIRTFGTNSMGVRKITIYYELGDEI